VPKVEGATQRLFIGVPVTEKARDAIAARLPSPIPGRLVPKHKWHFTLRFLGDTDSAAIPSLIESLDTSELGKSFDIGFAGLGAFPTPRRARVLWVGLDKGVSELEILAFRVESAVKRAGFPPEPRPFKPHLTISRIQPASQVVDVLAQGGEVRGAMQVTEAILYRSHMGRGSSSYEELARFPLDRHRNQASVEISDEQFD
jgi:2'-5' RNA ligase